MYLYIYRQVSHRCVYVHMCMYEHNVRNRYITYVYRRKLAHLPTRCTYTNEYKDIYKYAHTFVLHVPSHIHKHLHMHIYTYVYILIYVYAAAVWAQECIACCSGRAAPVLRRRANTRPVAVLRRSAMALAVAVPQNIALDVADFADFYLTSGAHFAASTESTAPLHGRPGGLPLLLFFHG